MQILSHQSKIATRVELFTGLGDDYFHCQWTRLGYLSLDNNERSQYKARELKSVYVKAKGQFMKLVVHKCYLNQLNLYNQVGGRRRHCPALRLHRIPGPPPPPRRSG